MTLQNELLATTLLGLLKLRAGSDRVLSNRESTQLEFKQSYHAGNLARYGKTMASFSNNKGGYLVFGVKPSPHTLVGVNPELVEKYEPAHLAGFLNDHFSPTIEWEAAGLEYSGIQLFFIYTYASENKPIIVTNASGGVIKSGNIFFRYYARSETIRPGELTAIINGRVERERRALLQHLKVIQEVGATNVSILDSAQGKLFGGGRPFLVDEKLLRKMKMVQKGAFSDTEGAPTLRLVGDVTSAHVGPERKVPTAIHLDDIVTSFLNDPPPNNELAKLYLQETGYQNTPNLPIFFLVKSAKLPLDKAIDLLRADARGYRSIRQKLIKRLQGGSLIKPAGALGKEPKQTPETASELVAAIQKPSLQSWKRVLLVRTLSSNPTIALKAIDDLPPMRVLEAITHIDSGTAHTHGTTLREILSRVFQRHGNDKGPIGSMLRRTVACLDQNLYGSQPE